MRVGHLCLVVSAALALWVSSPATAAPEADPEMAHAVAVSDVVATPSLVRARLTNLTEGTLSDIRVLVTHAFLWNREMDPGEDNPGRSDVFVIKGPIPPHGSITIEEQMVTPLQPRPDGRYQTSLQVLGFTKVG
jgi:hypothetical protein